MKRKLIGCNIRSLSDCARTRILEAWLKSMPPKAEYRTFTLRGKRWKDAVRTSENAFLTADWHLSGTTYQDFKESYLFA
jgi:hypothetical protein